ncbi:hypothetical protein COU37_00200 [Candidatus Micrarchaeota archaeon CG10_big_fil_rev_8_21_14_0_10_45_29]|nr:MAG: hypothetical protein COU37_00200 [Candidatus Micrarchaeota archaeon CG10_big_fil_rev_8_21_14_0_10_45_29]
MGLFSNGGSNSKVNGNGIAGPPACKTCATSCFGSKMPLGKSFDDFSPPAQQKLERLRALFSEAGAAFRSAQILEGEQKENEGMGRMALAVEKRHDSSQKMGEAEAKKQEAQNTVIGIISQKLVSEDDFPLFSQTVLRMISMHAGSAEAERFLNSG